MFTVEERERAHEHVVRLANSDKRIVAGAVVGALAEGEGDRWSDLDLTFALAEGVALDDVLVDWTRRLAQDLDAIHLFDIDVGPTRYRVFLLPGSLQLDLSFTPAAEFAPRGPRFRLLFGTANAPVPREGVSPYHLFGLAAHHAVRARFCIERGRLWQAEYWISALRDHALELACLRRGLPTAEGRGFDRLPADVRERFDAALVRSTERDELLRALAAAVDGLIAVAEDVRGLEPRLRELLRGP
jgi:hypothetical protein